MSELRGTKVLEEFVEYIQGTTVLGISLTKGACAIRSKNEDARGNVQRTKVLGISWTNAPRAVSEVRGDSLLRGMRSWME